MESTLVLASASPRRRELLLHLGRRFEVLPADIDESPLTDEAPAAHVLRLSREKAAHVFGLLPFPSKLVLAADTIVTIDGAILGKPHSPRDASRMLRLLSGRTHEVFTGFTAQSGDQVRSSVVRTEVSFAPLSGDEIERYIETGEPLDKAGAYAIQGSGGGFVRELRGSLSNVIGLPVVEVKEMLALFPEWSSVKMISVS